MKKTFYYTMTMLLVLSITLTYGDDNPWKKNNQSKAGIAGFTFLKIVPTARIAGVGNAFTAMADDISAIFVNPAGITEAGEYAFHVSNTQWLVNSNLDVAAATMHLGMGHYIGLSFVGLIPEDTPERTTTSADPNGLTGRNITMYDYAIGLTYAVKMFDQFSLGIKANYVTEKIANLSASNLLFDIGSLYYTNFQTIRIAMGLRNFGSDAQYPDRILFHMPIVYNIGVAGEVIGQDIGSNFRVTLSAEASFYIDYEQRYQIGTEMWIMNIIALRGGYMFNAGTEDPWGRYDYDGNQFSLGFGGKFKLGNSNVLLDFSYTKSDDLFENPLRFSFGLSF